jgi:tetratricopeptide (TPR) repeat protein
VLKAFSLIKEESMNIDGRRIRMAIFAMALTFATALTTSLIQPTLAGRRGGDGRSMPSRSTSGSYRQPQGGGPGNTWSSGRNSGISPNRFSQPSPTNFSKNQSSPYWKKYGGWGKGNGPGHHRFGWGWGCWLDPSCSWPWYEGIPVADYANAYTDCAGVMIDGIDYSVPISQMPADTLTGADSDLYAAARAAFLRGDLDAALSAISQAIVQMPHNRDLHQFHSLVLFAKQDYCRSATVAYAVLEDGPGWTWDYLQALYPAPDIYTGQLRNLEHYVSANPSEANVRFLLGYHYLMLDHTDVARRQLAQGVELRPADKLSARILTGIAEAPTTTPVAVDNSSQTTAKRVATNPPVTDPIDAVSATVNAATPSLTGTWKADPEKKVHIELALRDDGHFQWKFAARGRSKEFSGKYNLNGQLLALTRDSDSDAMEGTVERTGGNSFRFRMKDAETDDPGLNFTR